ncbi:MAG: spondin domain-containing protein [Gammaproteobacteria bacterium]|nr:spondin domain-containing protein [Gammaproteobacteria bacterium]
MNTRKIILPMIGIAMGLGLQMQTHAAQISVTVENLTAAGGLYFTPLWVGFHDGSFDTFDVGGSASASIEAVAEGGDVSGLRADFASVAGGVDGVVTAPAGFPGAPVFDPTDMGSLVLDLDPATNRYFSFASMIIPSNDAFIGNPDPTAYQVFDATGAFTGPLDILVLGNEIWDAGTELNDGMGAAFSALGGTSTDEMMAIGVHTGLGILLGTATAAGTVIDPVLGDFTQNGFQLARIRINAVPEPQMLATFGLGLGLMLLTARRRRPGSRLAA